MNLEESQKAKVREWIEAGLQAAEVQQRLVEEFGLRLTYMEIRFLLADLQLQPKDKEPPPDPAAQLKAKESTAGAGGEPAGGSGTVSLTVDQVTRPGAVVSGRVTFSDGKRAEWYLDQMGRLGLVPAEKNYKPSQSDVMDFQVALQNELAKLGL
jgi:hypothetical protein